MGHKGHWGEYTGNAKWSRDHAHTKVTSKNYDDAVKDDAAHIDYLKRDIDYDNKHGHSDENMTADEKHISKLAGDMKYDKEHHSPNKLDKPIGEHYDGNLEMEAVHSSQTHHGQNKRYPGHTPERRKEIFAAEKKAAPEMSALHKDAIDPREDEDSYEYDYDFAADKKAARKNKK